MRRIAFIVLLSLFSGMVFAQNRVEVDYESPDSLPATLRELMEFLDVKYMKIRVHGDIRGKQWKLRVNEAHDGQVKTNPVFPYSTEFTDTVAVFTFIARDDGDSVKIFTKTPWYSGSRKYAVETANGTAHATPYILMETLPAQPYTLPGEVNLVAYTSGLQKDPEKTSFDFCGLRFAKTDPKEWQAVHKVPRFVYFSLQLK